jgi:hypothetical protein
MVRGPGENIVAVAVFKLFVSIALDLFVLSLIKHLFLLFDCSLFEGFGFEDHILTERENGEIQS